MMAKTQRDFIERRTGKDRRRRFGIIRAVYSGPNRRRRERRATEERRVGWVRISKWSSALLKDLKIAKYLLK
jgi:hypothetical protein